MTNPSIPQTATRRKRANAPPDAAQTIRALRRLLRANAPPGMAYCYACDEYKQTSEFRADNDTTSGLSYMCRECAISIYDAPRRKGNLASN